MTRHVDIPLSPDARALLDALVAHGYGAGIVGGAVRDTLMGRAVRDVDVVSDAAPDAMRLVCDDAAWCRRVYPVGERYGTLGVVLADGSEVEVSRPRTGSGEDDGATATDIAGLAAPDDATFGERFATDAGHRDFTINAMAVEWPSLALLDPTDGIDDLEAGLLRAPGDPEARFAEDPLRVLRAARFVAAFGFELDAATETAARAASSGLTRVAAERTRDELTALLSAPFAAEGLGVALRTGALAEVLPEVAALDGVAQPTFHDLDVLAHSVQTVANAPATPVMRWAALLHDTGKGPCRTVEASGRIRFFGHARESARIAAAVCERLRFSKADTRAIVHLVAEHMRLGDVDIENPKAMDRAVRRLDLWEPNAAEPTRLVSAEDALELTLADFAATAHRAEADAARARIAGALAASRERGTRMRVASPLSGRDVMDAFGLEEGPAVGAAMRAVEDAIAEGVIEPDDRAAALEVAAEALRGC